jgi:hypothetical protein
MRRSGWTLIVAGVLGVVFFWLTDPRIGLIGSPPERVVDAANEAMVGTAIGVACSVIVLGIGVWMLTRRAL